jgi:hypothetical protein
MSPRSVYIWCGKGSTGDEREMAKKIAVEGKADPTIVSEGWYFFLVLGSGGTEISDSSGLLH